MVALSPLTICPTCQGTGLIQHTEGSITCTTCLGKGMWIDQAPIRVAFTLPAWVSPKTVSHQSSSRSLRYIATAISIAGFIGTAAFVLLRQPTSLVSVVWHPGLNQFLFGLSGLSSIYCLSLFEKRRTSTFSLHDLEKKIQEKKPEEVLDLEDFANTRFLEIIDKAAVTATKYNKPGIDDLILFITLIEQPRIQVMLARLEISSAQLISLVVPLLSPSSTGSSAHITLDPSVRHRLYEALEEAIKGNFPYIDLEDLFLTYFKRPETLVTLFKSFELTYEAVYAVTRWYAEEQERVRQWQFWLEKGRTRPQGYMNRAWTALPTPFLDQFSQDITRQASSGGVRYASIREPEISQTLQVLGRTDHNSVLLVGEPGVGKETVLEAVALRMIEENVPEILKDKRLVSVDINNLLSSSGGNAQASMQKMLQEIEQAGNVILAIADVQVLVGTSNSALDAASLLSEALNRGYLQVISTATYSDYHRYVESNTNLKSLLQTIEIKPPTTEQSISILEEEAPVIESKQGVFLTFLAIQSSVVLAEKYFPDQMLPGSALSLLDEAASRAVQEKHRWVTHTDVEKIVELRTKVPVSEATTQEADLLLHLEEKLGEKIIGQKQAVKAVADALRRSRAGLHTGKRPISSFLFVGPTGVGKTETAKAVSDLYFSGQSNMLRLDMSEYQDAKAVYKLIGSPAADSESYTEGGTLTQPIREHPFSLILLDELEKAYPDVLNLFLQLLDDGRLTENTGRTVHYNNTILVATSNAGVAEITSLMSNGTISQEELPRQLLRILQQTFRPEFLNRFDAIVPFYPLRPEEVDQVVEIMLKEVIEATKAQGYTITFQPDAIHKIGLLGFDPLYGARPLRRVIQDKVEGMLATKILDGSLTKEQNFEITSTMLE